VVPIKRVLWALDITATRGLRGKLAESLGEEVLLVGVGPLSTAEEVLAAMREVGAEEAVVAIEDPCEVYKLLSAGVHPLLALVEEVYSSSNPDACRAGGEDEVVVAGDEGCKVLRVKEFARVEDVTLLLAEPGEKHEHQHEER
jgi:hypothetical protein